MVQSLTVIARDPFALAILALSIAIAVSVALHDQWSERAWWIVVWGCLVYTVAVAMAQKPILKQVPPSPPPPRLISPVPPEFRRLVRPALQVLNKPGKLSECELIKHTPATLAAALKRDSGEPSPAGAMRQLLLQAIERLRPANPEGRGANQANVVHQVIYDEYVLEKSNASIMIRLSLPEKTFFNKQNDGVIAIARDLWVQERQVAGR